MILLLDGSSNVAVRVQEGGVGGQTSGAQISSYLAAISIAVTPTYVRQEIFSPEPRDSLCVSQGRHTLGDFLTGDVRSMNLGRGGVH